MQATLNAAYDALEKLVTEFREALDGIPDEDIASWRPAIAGDDSHEMNTFAAMGVHTVSAGQWMLLHQVYGNEVERDRESEFRAAATRAQIDEMFDDWMSGFRDLIDTEAQVDLSLMPPTIRESIPTWTRLHWLFHMIDHTALHLGHAQVQRQMWLAERSVNPQ